MKRRGKNINRAQKEKALKTKGEKSEMIWASWRGLKNEENENTNRRMKKQDIEEQKIEDKYRRSQKALKTILLKIGEDWSKEKIDGQKIEE